MEDHHKQIVQYFLHDGAYHEKELTDLLRSVRDRYDLKIRTQDEICTFVDNYLPVINKHLQPYGIEIKQVTSEQNENENYFVCIQNFKSQFVKMDSSYTEKEAAIFEKLLELIITNDEKCINPRDVFESILSNDMKVTQKEFGEIMTRFHQDKWIESGPNNTVILHARAIAEMQSFILDTYREDVYNCQICTRLLIRGLICSNSSCDIHMHRACAGRYFLRLANSATSNNQPKKTTYPCPACKKEWNANEVDSVMQSVATSTNGVSSANKKQRISTSNDSQTRHVMRSSNRRFINDNDE